MFKSRELKNNGQKILPIISRINENRIFKQDLYYSASNFIKTLVQSNKLKVIPKMSLMNISVSLFKELTDSDYRTKEKRMISFAPAKLCDYGRSRMEMIETVKGF